MLNKILNKTINKIKEKLQNKSFKQILLVTILLVGSRIFGFFRQALIGSSYVDNSTIKYSDVFLNTQKIQDALIAILIMGTFISTLTPSGALIIDKEGDVKFDKYIQWYIITISLVFGLISLFCYVFIENILMTIQKGFYIEYQRLGILDLYVNSARIMCFGFVFFAINTVLQIYLNLKDSFFWNNLSGVVTNIILIIALLISDKNFVLPLTIAILISFIVNMFIHLYGAYKVGFRWRFNSINDYVNYYGLNKDQINNDLKRLVPRIFLIPLSTVAAILVSTKQYDLFPTFYETASTIQGIFLTVISAVGMVLLPKLSIFNNSDSPQVFIERINTYIKKFLPLAILGTIGTFIFARFLLLLVISSGNFKKGIFKFVNTDSNFELQVLMIQVLSFSILFIAINEILIKYYLVKNKIKQLLIYNTLSILVFVTVVFIGERFYKFNFALNIAFVFSLSTALLTALYYIGIHFDKKKISN